ncbi:MAG: amino acid ABC transporter substrate-binding protein [Chitinophagaceae bacterium]|nr:amino acid ABC transporter substrate-binding protein [Chitinophagaceae bacterium]
MKKTFYLFLFSTLFYSATSQTLQPLRHKVAVFAPLYLDSVFDAAYNYRFGKTFPKFINPGLEFYEGAQLALDSLKRVRAPLEVFILDSRSRRGIVQQLNSTELKDVEMFIAHANLPEVRLLADAAKKRKIPFISATLPNDAGVTNNPYFVILNSTLRTHCEGIYRYLQKYNSLDRIVVFRKNGVQEDQIKNYLKEFGQTTASAPLKIDFVDIGANFTSAQLIPKLDSTRKTVCIAGSLDESFGNSLAQQLALVKDDYPLTIFGMPTWDAMNFNKPEFTNVEIIYSTPFYYYRPDRLSTQITTNFTAQFNGRPTDMFYRGYEVMLRFALLLLDTKKDVASNLTRKGNYIFTNFDIQPVFLNRKNMTLDYFENKRLYFIRVWNGVKTWQ